jgi:hypothetical protein
VERLAAPPFSSLLVPAKGKERGAKCLLFDDVVHPSQKKWVTMIVHRIEHPENLVEVKFCSKLGI